jgi:hypothetical protein
MPTSGKPKRKRGRPLSGKTAYCIRMSPRSYAVLLRSAQERGLPLGGWLEEMALTRRHYDPEAPEESNFGDLVRRFKATVAESTELTNDLYELFDEEPKLANGETNASLQRLVEAHARLIEFMEWEGVRFHIRASADAPAAISGGQKRPG